MRTLVVVATMALVMTLAFPVFAEETQGPKPYIYAGYSTGIGKPCGTCPTNDRKLWNSMMLNQLSVGYVRPFTATRFGSPLWGVYLRGEMWEDIPRGAGGVHLGWNAGKLTLLAGAGVAYSGERVKDTEVNRQTVKGEPRATYDFNLSAEYLVWEKVGITLTAGHLSNGADINARIFGGRGQNIGNDYLSVGFRTHFDTPFW